MRFVVNSSQITFWRGLLQLDIPATMSEQLNKLAGQIEAKKHAFEVTIQVKRQKRSLTANAALWAMLGDMAAELSTTAEELYIEELGKYGHFEYFMCKPEALTSVAKAFRICKERERRTVNGVDMVVVQAWPGSSTYDTKQFSVLLDGVIQDAKELGIPFISTEEKMLLLEEREKEEIEKAVWPKEEC